MLKKWILFGQMSFFNIFEQTFVHIDVIFFDFFEQTFVHR